NDWASLDTASFGQSRTIQPPKGARAIGGLPSPFSRKSWLAPTTLLPSRPPIPPALPFRQASSLIVSPCLRPSLPILQRHDPHSASGPSAGSPGRGGA